jgi:hypothetical protein
LLVADELPWYGPLKVEMKLGLLYTIAGVPKLLEVQRLGGGEASPCNNLMLAAGNCSCCTSVSLERISLIFSAMPFEELLYSGCACSGRRADIDRGVKKGDWLAETNVDEEDDRFLDGAETIAPTSELSC